MTSLFQLRGSRLRLAINVFVIGLALALAGCQRPSSSVPANSAKQEAAVQPGKTETATVVMHDCPLMVRVQGSLIGDEQAVIGAKVAGRIKEVTIDLGTIVKRGDVLTVLDTAELELRVNQAQAQLMQARAAIGMKPDDREEELDREKAPPVRQETAMIQEAASALDRAKELERRNQNLITKEEVQQREATLAVAVARKAAAINSVDEKIALLSVRRAELDMARQTLADAVITAPFDGVVQQRHVAPGVYVNISQSVVTLVRTNPLRFQAGVPEREALAVQAGQPISIQLEGVPQPLLARITRISPALEMSSRSLTIEADVPNPNFQLRAGLFAEAQIVIDAQAQAVAVPARAIAQFAGVEKVTLLRDGQPKEVQVSTGRRVGELVEILSGLKLGDQIVLDGRDSLAGAE